MNPINIFSKHGDPKQKILTAADERTYERECLKLKQFENATKSLQNHTKEYTELVTGLARCEKALAGVLNSYCNSIPAEDSSDLRDLVNPYSVKIPQIDAACEDAASVSRNTLSDSMKKLDEVFEAIHNIQKKRDMHLQDCLKHQAKVEKYSEKVDRYVEATGINRVKKMEKEKALNAFKSDLQQEQAKIIADVEKLYQHKVEYCQHGLDAFMSSESMMLCALTEVSFGGDLEYRERSIDDLIMELGSLSTTTAKEYSRPI